jgi:glycosyltransferase involved in cell wall biosynthesis
MLSIVVSARNEQENVETLVSEIDTVLASFDRGYEVIVVDDTSTDGTYEILCGLQESHPTLRVLRMCPSPAGRGRGQSVAYHAGFRAARGAVIAVLDADLQNDPADIPAMLERLDDERADLVQGDRTGHRRDNAVRRVSSWVGRLVRRTILGDTVRDTGCSLRVMRRDVARSLPLEFRGMHRYIPHLAARLGFRVVEMPVNHRPRRAGRTKYGVWNRALPALVDCLAVRWMNSRRQPARYAEAQPGTPAELPDQERQAVR